MSPLTLAPALALTPAPGSKPAPDLIRGPGQALSLTPALSRWERG